MTHFKSTEKTPTWGVRQPATERKMSTKSFTHVPLNEDGLPVDGNGVVDMSLVFACQVCYTLKHFPLHNQRYLAQAFTKLAEKNDDVRSFLIKNLRDWNKKEMSMPDHDGDFDSCFLTIPHPYIKELSLNIYHLEFRSEQNIKELYHNFLTEFSDQSEILQSFVGQVQSLGIARSHLRSQIRLAYNSQDAEKARIERENVLQKQKKLMKTFQEAQELEISQRIASRLEKEKKKNDKETEKKRKLEETNAEKDAKKRRLGCIFENCTKSFRGGKSWHVCSGCENYKICSGHTKEQIKAHVGEHQKTCNIGGTVSAATTPTAITPPGCLVNPSDHPEAVPPQLSSPEFSSPEFSSPELPSSQLASLQLSPPQLSSPQLSSSQWSSQLSSLQLSSPQFSSTTTPTLIPTLIPTLNPTLIPTLKPTLNPTLNPPLPQFSSQCLPPQSLASRSPTSPQMVSATRWTSPQLLSSPPQWPSAQSTSPQFPSPHWPSQ